MGVNGPRDMDARTKAKSTTVLQAARKQNIRTIQDVLTNTPPSALNAKTNRKSAPLSDEWLYRAGLAIASATGEEKGQTWLSTRASSTSLVVDTKHVDEQPRDRDMTLTSGENFADDEFSPVTPRYSRFASRPGSRGVSRANSAYNSRRGSRVNLQTPRDLNVEGYFDQPLAVEPDFVDPDEDSGDDEEEVARLASQNDGISGVVNRLMGWSLFSVGEDGEQASEDEHEENMTRDDVRKQREAEVARRKAQLEHLSAPPTPGPMTAATTEESESKEAQGGWQDAAWLLSVAHKALVGND